MEIVKQKLYKKVLEIIFLCRKMNVKICFFIFYSFLSSFGRIVQSQGHGKSYLNYSANVIQIQMIFNKIETILGSIANSVFTDILDIDGRIQTLIYRIRFAINNG